MPTRAIALAAILWTTALTGCTSQQTEAMLCGPSTGGWPSNSYGPADIEIDALMLAGCAAKTAIGP